MTPEVTEQVGAIGEAAIACANVGAAVLAVWWCIKCWRYINEAAGVGEYWVGCPECGAELAGDHEGSVCWECGCDLADEYDIDPDNWTAHCMSCGEQHDAEEFQAHGGDGLVCPSCGADPTDGV